MSPRANLDFDPNRTPPSVPSEEQGGQVKQGQLEAVKENVKEQQKSLQKLDNLVNLGDQELFRCKSIRLLSIFPTEVIIDLNKVTIIYNTFIGAARIHSVFIQDITDVLIGNSIFYSTLIIVDAGFTENQIEVKYIRKQDARDARRLIQGLVIAKKQGIDFTQLTSTPEIVDKLHKLGESKMST